MQKSAPNAVAPQVIPVLNAVWTSGEYPSIMIGLKATNRKLRKQRLVDDFTS